MIRIARAGNVGCQASSNYNWTVCLVIFRNWHLSQVIAAMSTQPSWLQTTGYTSLQTRSKENSAGAPRQEMTTAAPSTCTAQCWDGQSWAAETSQGRPVSLARTAPNHSADQTQCRPVVGEIILTAKHLHLTCAQLALNIAIDNL